METRIYLVEDDAVIAGAVARHMEAWGCRVKAAEDFSNILEEFRSFAPQLVLLDIYLPFSTAITGVRRSGRSHGCRSSFSPLPRTI